jgi:hypothetical protein
LEEKQSGVLHKPAQLFSVKRKKQWPQSFIAVYNSIIIAPCITPAIYNSIKYWMLSI